MKRLSLILLVVFVFVLGLSGQPAAAEILRLRQEIRPLDCLDSRVVTGVGISASLMPQNCDDFDPPTAPKPPDTGVYRDPWASAAIAIIVGIIALASAVRWLLPLSKRAKVATLGSRVSSSRRPRAK